MQTNNMKMPTLHPNNLIPCLLILLALLVPRPSPVSAQSKPVFACDIDGKPSLKNLGFCDKLKGVSARVADLVKRLTLDEKVTFLVNAAGNVTRLGIPHYEWWSEAIHGISYIGPGTRFSSLVPGATSFPQVILTAASFNATLFETIGKVTHNANLKW